MPWLELRLDTNAEQAELLEDALLNIGALAVTYTDAGDQPILEPGVGEMPLWPDIIMVGLFEATTDTEATTKMLAAEIGETPSYGWNILEEKVWEREWLKHHQPVKFGNRFWVFHEEVKGDELPTLLLDPGLAFGTGSHPTTALCLDWIANQSWGNNKLIDYGCGSGILAIAAALLGCKKVLCTDIDPQALMATRDNGRKNGLSDQSLELFLAGQEPGTMAPVSALVANILAGPLIEMAGALAGKVTSGGNICLSGILAEQGDGIVQAYQPWFKNFELTQSGDWLRVTAQRI
jgi:ribosomal protein L11 methyltransferase